MSNNVDKFSAYLEAAKQQKNTPEQVLARQQQVFERDIAPKLPKEKVEQARQHWQSLTTPLIEQAGFIKFDQPDPKILNSKQYGDNLNKFYQSGIGLDAAKQQAYEQTRRDLTPEKGILGYGRDIGLSALKGAISVPEAAVGLIDIPTGGRIGKFLENEGGIIGFRPEVAKAALDDLHTDKYKLQQQDFANATGLMAKLGVVADNPSLVVNPVVESLPLMGAGGVVGRGIMAVAPRVSGLAAGASGEGAVSAGIQAEQIRSQTDDGHLSGKQSLLAATTGGVTGALSLGGAGLARRFGVADVDTMLASGMGSTAAMANKGIARRVAEGAVTEGLLEELPQSISEQMQQNAALDKPLDQGVMDNAIIGTLSGAAMGGGFAGYAGMQRNSQVKQIKQAQTDLPNALTQAQAGLQAAQQAGDPTGLQAAQQQYDVVLEAVNATNAKASEYGINSHTPEFKNLIDSLGLSNPADPQPGDIGRVSDGQPFANKNAALNYQKKNGLADTHEIVRLGASPQFVLRDKNPVQPEPEAEQAQQELLGLPAPVYEVTPDGTVITTADRNAQVQQQHQDEADRLDRINRGEMRDVTPIPVSDTPIQPPTPGLAGVAERALQRDAEVSARKEVDFKELYTRARLNGDNETANQVITDAFTSGIDLSVLRQWRKEVEPEVLAQQEQEYQSYLGQQPEQSIQQLPTESFKPETPKAIPEQPATTRTTADDIRDGLSSFNEAGKTIFRDQTAENIRSGKAERLILRNPNAIEMTETNPYYHTRKNDDGTVSILGVLDSSNNWVGLPPSPGEDITQAGQIYMLPTDIGRISDGQPFANRNAAVNHQRKNNLADSHDVVQIGNAKQFVLRPKSSEVIQNDVPTTTGISESNTAEPEQEQPDSEGTAKGQKTVSEAVPETAQQRRDRLENERILKQMHARYRDVSDADLNKEVERLSNLIQRNIKLSENQVVNGKRSTRKAVAAQAVDNFRGQLLDLENYLSARKDGSLNKLLAKDSTKSSDGSKPNPVETASESSNPFDAHDTVAKQYGRSVKPDGTIVSSSGQDSGLRVVQKKGRLRVETHDGQLMFSGANHESLGAFIEKFWGGRREKTNIPVGAVAEVSQSGSNEADARIISEISKAIQSLMSKPQGDSNVKEFEAAFSAKFGSNVDSYTALKSNLTSKAFSYFNAVALKLKKPLSNGANTLVYLRDNTLQHSNISAIFKDVKDGAKIEAVLEPAQLIQDDISNGLDINDNAVVKEGRIGSKKPQFSYAGKKSTQANYSLLNEAERLEKDGLDSEAIRRVTGWFRGMDKKWRYEIGDDVSFAKGTGTAEQIISARAEVLGKSPYGSMFGEEIESLTLNDVLRHPKLFNAYPALNNVKIKLMPEGAKHLGAYNPVDNIIEVNGKLSNDEFHSMLLHETQHAIQEIEGFNRGGNPKQFKPIEEIKHPEKVKELEDEIAQLSNKIKDEQPDLHRLMSKAEHEFESIKSKYPEGDRAVNWYAVPEDITNNYLNLMDELNKHKDYVSLYDLKQTLAAYRNDKRFVDTYMQYMRLAGEIEARDVESRKKLSDIQRSNIEPYASQAATYVGQPDIKLESTLAASDKAGFTTADARQILVDRFSEETITKLEQSGKLEIVDNLDDLPQDAFNSITAYHGSPYKFDKFSLEHLGRGEGAQLFGYGLYFADNKAVGDFYRKNLSKDGQLYRVDIDADKLLQWELPLSKQAEQEALASIKQQLDDAGLLEHYEELIGRKFDSWTGAILHTVLKNAASNQQLPDNNNLDVMEAQEYQKPDKAVSMYLNSHGIDGIRYLDRGSRDGTSGAVSNNYVIFDDSAIQIVQTYYSQNPGGIEGYHHNGKTVLVASNLTADTVIPTFLHEVGGHAGLQGVMPAKTYDALMQQFDAMVKAGNPLAVDAKRRAEVESDPETQRSEYLPYLITVASQAQNKRGGPFQAIQRMIQRIVSAVKAWAVDKLGVNLKVTPDDVLALAERMVNRVAIQASKSTPRTYGEVISRLNFDELPLEKDQGKDPLIQKFARLTESTLRAEKISDPDTWTAEQRAAYARGDNAEFSRLRGYTAKEIAQFDDMVKTSKEVDLKYGDGTSQDLSFLIQEQTGLLAYENNDTRFSRTPWQPDFPDAVVLHRADEVQSHPDYKAAKAGDTAAAVRLIRDVVTDEDLAKLKKLVGDTTDLVVAVHAEEQSGRNKIPLIFATYLEQKLGIQLDHSIMQAKKVNRGGSDGVARLIKTVPFDGHVEAGKRYLIVDDTLTQGGTLASLKGYIEENGGEVVGASTLMGKQYSAKMAIQPETLANLRKQAGKDFEQWWNETLGYSFSELTESEARYLTTLIRKSDANTVRDRLIEAGRTGSSDIGTQDVQGNGQQVTGKPRFSRQSPPPNGQQQASQFDAISQQAMYQWQLQSGKMAKVPKHIGKFLGTMLHKALTNPEFKKPFDLIQAKINHVSVEAYDSLRQAPEVLGHMEDWKDFKREASNLLPKNFKARKADFAKVSDAVFNGTLNDKKVYSDAELRAMGLNDNQIGIYHDIRNAIDTSLDHYARSVMSKIIQAAGVPMNEIMALHNRDLPVFAHQLELERLADRYAGTDGQDVMANAKERITEVMEKLGKLKEEGYAPLMRFGDHYLKITDPNLQTSDNPDGTVLRQHYESETERDLVARRLQQSLPAGHQLETGSLNPDDYKMFAGVSPETVALFIKESGLPMDDVTQQYLKLATAQHSALRRLIHRKGIEGFSDDVQRVLAAFVMSNARYSANRLFNDQIDQAVMDVKDGELRQQAQKMRDYALDPKEEMRGVKNFMFLYYMGGSVMFGLINMTQPIMQTFPHLTRYAGGAAFGNIMRGLKQAMQSLKTNTPPAAYQADYEKAQREGHLDPQNVWMLQGLERGKAGLANSGWQVFSHAMGYIASVTETINRRATLFAALDTAKKMGAAKLANLGFASEYDFAIRAIQETQGIYNKGNRPRMARGNVGSLLMMYKQFGIAYIEQMIRATNDPMWAGERDDKRKALLLMLALLFTTAGLTGLPFAKDLMDLVETGTGMAGKPMNLERETQLFLRERMGDEFGQTVADGLMYGPFNFNPVVDIQGRTNMGNQLPGTGAFKMTNDSFETSRQLTEIGGATGGLLQNMYNSMMFLQRGKSEEAMAALAPKAIGDAYKGAKGVATGQLMNERGDKVTDLSMAESLVKVIGGQPARVADEGRTRGYEQKDKQIKNAMSRYFRQRLEDAYNDGGADDVKSVREDIKKWNADNSRYPINIRDSDIKKRVKNSNSTWQERTKVPKGMEWMGDLRPE